jgi:hypothetical protein
VNARLDLDRFTQAESVWRFQDLQFKPLSFDRPERTTTSSTTILGRKPDHGSYSGSRAMWPGAGGVALARLAGTRRLRVRLLCGRSPPRRNVEPDDYQVLAVSVHPEYWTRECISS